MNKYFFLEIPLLYKCNQQCYYCNVWKLSNKIKYIDLSYLNWILNQYPKNLFIELTGGELGLLDKEYLKEIINLLKNHNHVKKIQLNSNGLIRLKYPEIIEEFDFYNEHLIFDIKNKNILKFYDLEIFPKNIKNLYSVVVLTNNTLDSILNNFDYFKKLNFFNNKIYLKVMNFKSKILPNKEKMKKLYEKIIKEKLNIKSNLKSIFCNTQQICSLISHSPALNLLDNKIYHCSINFELSERKEITKENIRKHYNGNLFSNCKKEYCKICYTPICNKEIIIDIIQGNYWNRMIND